MDLLNILTQYDRLEAELLYNKTIDLFNLITNQELEEYSENSIILELNSKSTERIKEDKQLLKDAIDLFSNIIKSRKL